MCERPIKIYKIVIESDLEALQISHYSLVLRLQPVPPIYEAFLILGDRLLLSTLQVLMCIFWNIHLQSYNLLPGKTGRGPLIIQPSVCY